MRNFYIYIRERLLWDEKVAANSYVIPDVLVTTVSANVGFTFVANTELATITTAIKPVTDFFNLFRNFLFKTILPFLKLFFKYTYNFADFI